MRLIISSIVVFMFLIGTSFAGIAKTQSEFSTRTVWLEKKIKAGDLSDIELGNYKKLKSEVDILAKDAHNYDRSVFYKKMKSKFVELGRIIKDGTKYNIFQRLPDWL